MKALSRSTGRVFASLFLGLALAISVAQPANAALNFSNAAKAAILQALCTQIDIGGAAGKLEIGTNNSGNFGTLLVEYTLNYNPSCTVGLSGQATVLTFAGFPKTDSSANNSGTAALARFCTSAGCSTGVVISGITVGLTGTSDGTQEIELDSINITAGQAVTANGFTITQP